MSVTNGFLTKEPLTATTSTATTILIATVKIHLKIFTTFLCKYREKKGKEKKQKKNKKKRM